MRVGPSLSVVALAAALAGCGATVSDINGRPAKYYQHKVDFVAQIVRMQRLPSETVLEVADAHGSRILVRSTEPVEAAIGDWIRVRGLLVPEARVADTVAYDVVMAEHTQHARAPRLRNLF
jgi:hypothetical protein